MGDDPNQCGNSRRWIIAEVENSLRRLKTDWIDLYQIHRPEPDTDIDETLGALTDLVRAGKIRYFGSSTFPASPDRRGAVGRASAAAASASSASSRPTRCSSAASRPTCCRSAQRYGMGVIPWSPLAGGWLSRPLPQGRRAAGRRSRAQIAAAALRHVDARQPAQARGRRRARRARRRGRDLADRAGARVRHSATRR